MELILISTATVISLLVLAVLVILFFYRSAVNKQQATFVKEGTIEFVVAGSTLVKVLENVRGFRYKEKETEIQVLVGKEDDEEITLPNGKKRKKWKLVLEPIEVGRVLVEEDENEKKQKASLLINPKKWLERKYGFFWVDILYLPR